MDNFNLKEYLASNPLYELAMERAELYPILRKFLSNYSINREIEREAANELALQLVKDFEKFDAVSDVKELPRIIMNMEDEFLELFKLLSQYFDFKGDNESKVLHKFINYLRNY